MDSPKQDLQQRFEISNRRFVGVCCWGIAMAVVYGLAKVISVSFEIWEGSPILLGLRLFAGVGFLCVGIFNAWRLAVDLRLAIAAARNIRASQTQRIKRLGLSPEFIAELAGFLVSCEVRKRCFEPYFEDLKADRLEKLARSGSRGVKCWIECCFYLRLCVTVFQSLGCYLGETLSKLAPFIRALFFKGGS